MEITRRDNQTEAFNTRISNIIQVSTSKALRPASISDVEENIFKLPLYGNDGKDRTVNVSKDSNAKNHNLLINYIFNFDQSVDNLRKTINDFDLVVASITDNPSPSGNCELLKGQAIPFKSPFCGRELEWTKINQEFKSDHKAIDIVPNSEYAKSNPQYLRDKPATVKSEITRIKKLKPMSLSCNVRNRILKFNTGTIKNRFGNLAVRLKRVKFLG